MIIPVISNPCFEQLNEVRRDVEADQSFDISISFN